MIPASAAGNRIRPGTVALFARRKEQHHILYGNEMTLLLTSGSSHTISLKNTLPHTGGAGPTKTTTGPTPQGGRARGQTKRPDGESNKAQQDIDPLDRQAGIPWGGGGGGVWQPCIIYVCVCMYIHVLCIYLYRYCGCAPVGPLHLLFLELPVEWLDGLV